MKIKNFKISQQAISTILSAALYITAMTGSIIYYQYEKPEQTSEINIDDNNISIDADGKAYCYFDIGEHIITISRNDAYYHKSENVEGYAIKEVEINGWRDNNKITYVNTVPVIVEATKEKNGQYEFSNFGKVITDKNKTKTYTQ